MPSARVLVVDDDRRDIELLLSAIRQLGPDLDVQVLRDGAEALDYLHKRGPFADRPSGEPCVILLDLKMPKVDGFEVLRDVRAVERLRHVPVVVMTSSREPNDVSRCYQLGANAYVVKALAYDEFSWTARTTVAFWAQCNLTLHEDAP